MSDSVLAQRERWLTRALDEVATPAQRKLPTRLADSHLPTAGGDDPADAGGLWC